MIRQKERRLSLICLVSLMTLGTVRAADEVVVYNQLVKPGGTIQLPVQVSCDNDYAAFQMDFTLPEGITVPANGSGDPQVTLVEEMINGHNVTTAYLENGGVRVASYAMPTAQFKSKSGLLLNLPLQVSSSFSGGTVTLNNIRFTNIKSKETLFPTVNVSVEPLGQKTLNTSFKQGWNWVSQNTENTRVLATYLQPLGTVERIMSATEDLILDPDFGLVGGLEALYPEYGYRIKVAENKDCVFEAGLWCWPEDYPVTLHKGWNWIGYLPFEPMSPDVALMWLKPQEDDRLVGFDSFADYVDGQWKGSLTTMRPGAAYHYHANAEASFCYPTSYPVSTVAPARADDKARWSSVTLTSDYPWEYDAHRYPDVTTVIAKLTYRGEPTEDWGIGAFCGDECRGVATQVDNVQYINIHGDISASETIRFMAWNAVTGEQVELSEQLDFDGGCVGSYKNPFVFNIDNITSIVQHADTASSMTVYSLEGVLVSRNATSQTLRRLPKGVYIVNGNKFFVK